jgi:uncharacterized membrane protein
MPRPGAREVLLLAVVLAAVVVVFATTVGGPGAMLTFLLPPAALFIVLYFVVRWAVAAGLRDEGGGADGRTAREILDARYAGGEIGAEDYERVRARLETP